MKTSDHDNKIPPGPSAPWLGLPLLGEMKNDLLGTAQRMREQYGDVVHFRMASQPYYYFFSPELIRELLVEHADDLIRHERAIEVFSLVYGDNVLTTEGDTWKRQRRILMPGFLPKKITGYVDLMTGAVADAMVTAFPEKGPAGNVLDVDSFTTVLTMDVILRVLFSHKVSEAESQRAFEASRALEHQGMRELFWPKTPPDWFPYPGRKQKLKSKADLENLIGSQVQVRRAAGEDQATKTDYLAMLLSAHDDEAQGASSSPTLSTEEIRDNCMVIFAAGHDTTATVMTWWIGLMAHHPEVAEKVRQEVAEVAGDRNPTADELSRMKWMNATIKEAMRLYPPTPNLFFRCPVRDIEIGGWHVPKGASINVPVWHVQHDARWFPEPESFRPERFMPNAAEIPRGAYMPFGAGPRVCIGQHLATIEMALIATFLIRQFDLSPGDAAGLPSPKIDMVLKPETTLRVKFTRR
ncbi:cytochrome P450 [Janthinobacterium sp. 17J80-10]|uniref:cytochrome P450 n=1 Tax=Janthinobacterium sp. 17J80-10 TaxID=2497863 RepID=UPI0010054086|nr:cytochrome P450 [Janthinobacterium sp. 17J80-10]QAU33442.1 cytochrome P450 [Janthinobacterium sp. 17J80-10]